MSFRVLHHSEFLQEDGQVCRVWKGRVIHRFIHLSYATSRLEVGDIVTYDGSEFNAPDIHRAVVFSVSATNEYKESKVVALERRKGVCPYCGHQDSTG